MPSADLPPSTTKLELRTAYGPVFRDVLNTPPRDCTQEEIPIIDLTALYSDKLEDRKALASQIRATAVNTGFFYIKNHGIKEDTIANAKKQLLTWVNGFIYRNILLLTSAPQILQAAR
jgi:hypothetical protein